MPTQSPGICMSIHMFLHYPAIRMPIHHCSMHPFSSSNLCKFVACTNPVILRQCLEFMSHLALQQCDITSSFSIHSKWTQSTWNYIVTLSQWHGLRSWTISAHIWNQRYFEEFTASKTKHVVDFFVYIPMKNIRLKILILLLPALTSHSRKAVEAENSDCTSFISLWTWIISNKRDCVCHWVRWSNRNWYWSPSLKAKFSIKSLRFHK